MEPFPKPVNVQTGERRAQEARALQPIFHDDDPTLEEMGIVEDDPAQGALTYTTQPDAIVRWYEEEHLRPENRGADVIRICEEYLGIDEATLRECPALQDYWTHVDAGRFIGTVAMQYDRTTPYYFANLFNLAEIVRKSKGRVPTAFMKMVYPTDYFSFESGDKTGAVFQGLEIPYSINGNGKVGYVSRDIQPAAILRSPSLNLAKGQQQLGNYNDQIVASLKPLAVQPDGSSSNKARENHRAQYYGARCNEVLFPFDEGLLDDLGITQMPEPIVAENSAYMRATDFYRALWDRTVSNMRNGGYLPSEDLMPMFEVDGGQLYKYLAEHAQPSEDFLAAHGWDKLPVRRDGIMYGAAYYIVQTMWPTVYLECSSCMYANDPVMQQALPTHDALRHRLGVKEKEVRLPDKELDEADAKAESTVIVHEAAFETPFRAYMKGLSQTLDDPRVQQIFKSL